MVKVIVAESEGTKITDYKTSPGGKSKKVIPHKDWQGDKKKLEKKAEKHKE